MITKEYLEEQLVNLTAQQEQLLAQANAASGAIELIKHLLTQTNDSVNTEQLEQMVGGKIKDIKAINESKS